MEVTKFHQLCSAYNSAQNNFEAYKKDCHLFSIEIVRELKAYYNIPESQFSLFKIKSYLLVCLWIQLPLLGF